MTDFHTWANPGQTDIDIIFVHGPGGDPKKTWTDEKSGLAWPKDKLAPQFKRARILSFNYEPSLEDFFVLNDEPDSTLEKIDNLSVSLCQAVLRLDKYSAAMKKRLVFITHSLGGLVCANLLSKQHGQPHYSDLVDVAGRCVKVVFLATPFCGNDLEAWKVIVGKLCPTAKVEANDGSGAIQVQQAFQKLLANRFSKPSFRVENLVEAGDEDTPNVVVTADSAELGTATPVEIQADHQSISKCVDDKNSAFEHMVEFLRKMEKKENPHKTEDIVTHNFSDIGFRGDAVYSHRGYLSDRVEFKGDVTGR